jgi:hypothetical protein
MWRRYTKFRRLIPWLCTLVFLLLLCATLVLGSYRRIGVSEPRASVTRISDKDVLILDGQDHPPWAQSHIVWAKVDNNIGAITVCETYRLFGPFGEAPDRGWPIVLDRNRLIMPRYTIQYWDGNRNAIIGKLMVLGDQLKLEK